MCVCSTNKPLPIDIASKSLYTFVYLIIIGEHIVTSCTGYKTPRCYNDSIANPASRLPSTYKGIGLAAYTKMFISASSQYSLVRFAGQTRDNAKSK